MPSIMLRKIISKPILWLFCLLLMQPGLLLADNINDYRTDVGLKLFKTLVSADQKLLDKKQADGSIKIALLYVNDLSNARKLEERLRESWTNIKGIPVTLELMTVENMQREKPPVAAAIFVTQELLEEELQSAIAYSLAHQIVIFSPFEGDVETGVLAGLSVQATVRPLLNKQALKQGGYDIKSFYLKVAKFYE